MPIETPKRIHLLGSGRTEEGVAGGTIKPGQLLQLNSSGQVVVHATAGGAAERAYAVEDALQGRGINDNYSSGERVSYVLASPGDVVYAWLGSGNNVSAGALLSSAGNGDLRAITSGHVALAVALEAVNATSSAQRIRVRVL
jgi:hypothetical protein